MCILQDFESITPNVLCRTMETVEGGGLVVLLLSTMTSLKQLYSLSMDVHARYRTEAHAFVEPRFNERFILSLGNCSTCIAIDDELNILPITSHIKEIKEVQLPGLSSSKGGEELKSEDLYLTNEQRELKELKAQLREAKPIGNLVGVCRTLDQARAVMQVVDAISEKSLKTTVSLTAGRGRGKSAALGISLAGAIVYGFSNIFVTAPTPENLGSVFEFLFRGLDALGYREHQDYEILQSTNPEFNNAVVRVNVTRDHRQTIQYVRPQDHAKLAQAELLIIDEAAAIPITIVKQLMGPYLILMSSTINGYEGTGRSLSLKLINQLRDQNRQR
jgi:N-acetyltransferase 10